MKTVPININAPNTLVCENGRPQFSVRKWRYKKVRKTLAHKEVSRHPGAKSRAVAIETRNARDTGRKLQADDNDRVLKALQKALGLSHKMGNWEKINEREFSDEGTRTLLNKFIGLCENIKSIQDQCNGNEQVLILLNKCRINLEHRMVLIVKKVEDCRLEKDFLIIILAFQLLEESILNDENRKEVVNILLRAVENYLLFSCEKLYSKAKEVIGGRVERQSLEVVGFTINRLGLMGSISPLMFEQFHKLLVYWYAREYNYVMAVSHFDSAKKYASELFSIFEKQSYIEFLSEPNRFILEIICSKDVSSMKSLVDAYRKARWAKTVVLWQCDESDLKECKMSMKILKLNLLISHCCMDVFQCRIHRLFHTDLYSIEHLLIEAKPELDDVYGWLSSL